MTHWLLLIHKILVSSTCFEPQQLIFKRIQLYARSVCYCQSLRDFLVSYRNKACVLAQAVFWQATRNFHWGWQYHMLLVYNCILLKMSTWGSKYVEENIILWRHPPTTFPLQSVLTQAVYLQATRNSHREWQYHALHMYNCILLKMSTWGSKHIEETNILWINNNQCTKVSN